MSQPFDASIPVLTEVFQNPAEADQTGAPDGQAPPYPPAQQTASPAPGGFYPAAPAPAEPRAGAPAIGAPGPGASQYDLAPILAPLQSTGPVVVPPPAPPGAYSAVAATPALPALGGVEWAQLERRLAEGVLLQLQGRIDVALEQALRDSIAAVLQNAVAGLTGEIRAGLQATVEHIVSRAVAQELAELRAQPE